MRELLAAPLLLLTLVGAFELFSTAAFADAWGPRIMAHCYHLDGRGRHADRHMFVRVFWTELGSGQLYDSDAQGEGVLTAEQLNDVPVSCVIEGREYQFETVGFTPRGGGPCGLCTRTGFRLTVDDELIWEVPWDEVTYAGFLGTVDADWEMVRVCTEHRPEELSIELPYEPDFFESRTSVLVCRTYNP